MADLRYHPSQSLNPYYLSPPPPSKSYTLSSDYNLYQSPYSYPGYSPPHVSYVSPCYTYSSFPVGYQQPLNYFVSPPLPKPRDRLFCGQRSLELDGLEHQQTKIKQDTPKSDVHHDLKSMGRSMWKQLSKEDDKNWTHQVFEEMPVSKMYQQSQEEDELAVDSMAKFVVETVLSGSENDCVNVKAKVKPDLDTRLEEDSQVNEVLKVEEYKSSGIHGILQEIKCCSSEDSDGAKRGKIGIESSIPIDTKNCIIAPKPLQVVKQEVIDLELENLNSIVKRESSYACLKKSDKKCENKSKKAEAKEHEEQLKRLKETQAHFYQYMKEHDEGLLKFDADEIEDDADFEAEIELEDAEKQGDDKTPKAEIAKKVTAQKMITAAMVDSWCKSIQEDAKLGAVRSILRAYKTACHYDNDDDLIFDNEASDFVLDRDSKEVNQTLAPLVDKLNSRLMYKLEDILTHIKGVHLCEMLYLQIQSQKVCCNLSGAKTKRHADIISFFCELAYDLMRESSTTTTDSDLGETFKKLARDLNRSPQEIFDSLKNQIVDLVLTAHSTQLVRRPLLKKHRSDGEKKMRHDVAVFLQSGQDATAQIRVGHVIREQNMKEIDKLSVKNFGGELKLKIMKEIAKEVQVDWDTSEIEQELFKPQEGSIDGPHTFVSASSLLVNRVTHEPSKLMSATPTTNDAGRISGLDVERTIIEPTAAALSHGMTNKKDVISVFDPGSEIDPKRVKRVNDMILLKVKAIKLMIVDAMVKAKDFLETALYVEVAEDVETMIFNHVLASKIESSSALSNENVRGTSKDGETLKYHEKYKGREMAGEDRSKKLYPKAVKVVVKDELIINLFNEAKGEAESYTNAVKISVQSTTPAIIKGSSVSTQLSLLELKRETKATFISYDP